MSSRRALLLGVALGLSFAVVGTAILAFFSAPIDKSEVAIDEPLTVRANEYRAQFFGYYSAYDNVVSFNVLNGTIYSCDPLNEWLYLEWQAGRYMPSLVEADQGIFQYGGTHVQYPMLGAVYARYLFFFNQDSYDKVVEWRVTAYWQEANTTNLAIGIALMIAGLGIDPGACISAFGQGSSRQTGAISC